VRNRGAIRLRGTAAIDQPTHNLARRRPAQRRRTLPRWIEPIAVRARIMEPMGLMAGMRSWSSREFLSVMQTSYLGRTRVFNQWSPCRVFTLETNRGLACDRQL
jgi:hypothetical protein